MNRHLNHGKLPDLGFAQIWLGLGICPSYTVTRKFSAFTQALLYYYCLCLNVVGSKLVPRKNPALFFSSDLPFAAKTEPLNYAQGNLCNMLLHNLGHSSWKTYTFQVILSLNIDYIFYFYFLVGRDGCWTLPGAATHASVLRNETW